MKKRQSFRDKVVANAKQAKNATSNYGYLDLPKGVQMYKETPGARVILDMLPYTVTSDNHPDKNVELDIATKGSIWYKRPFKTHRNVGGGASGKGDTIVCPTSFGKKCPICEYRAKRIREGAEKDETDQMKTSRRNLYAVIPLNDKNFEEKIHIWDISQFLFQNLFNDELDDNPDLGLFIELEGGKSLKIRFDSTTIGGGKPFAEASRIDPVDREEDYDESILDKVPKLDEILHELPYKTIEKMFFELDDETTEEEPEEEEPVKEKTGVSSFRKKKHIESEEEEPDKEPEQEEEPEEEEPVKEKPVRRKRKETPAKKENKCPFGHKFGKDTDEYDDCDQCDMWDDCLDEKEKE